jgi:hypothetical protein
MKILLTYPTQQFFKSQEYVQFMPPCNRKTWSECWASALPPASTALLIEIEVAESRLLRRCYVRFERKESRFAE